VGLQELRNIQWLLGDRLLQSLNQTRSPQVPQCSALMPAGMWRLPSAFNGGQCSCRGPPVRDSASWWALPRIIMSGRHVHVNHGSPSNTLPARGHCCITCAACQAFVCRQSVGDWPCGKAKQLVALLVLAQHVMVASRSPLSTLSYCAMSHSVSEGQAITGACHQ